MSPTEYALFALSVIGWVWAGYAMSAPRYFDDNGGVHRTAEAAEAASQKDKANG